MIVLAKEIVEAAKADLAECLKTVKLQLMASKLRIELEKKQRISPIFPFVQFDQCHVLV